MSIHATSARPAFAWARTRLALALLEREAPLVVALALYAGLIVAVLPQMLVQDSWLTLVMGREIFQHGLPHSETITVVARGQHWTDQQWLAQSSFYGLERIGGIRLVMLSHALLMSAAFGASLAAARARGASHKSILLVAIICCGIAPWGLQMRAQSFAPLLFVTLLWLLVSDSRTPGRRVLFVLPLLVLWANIHGTVLLGALLVLLRGLTRIRGGRTGTRARRIDTLALIASPALVLVSPYGLELVEYYRQMLVSPQLRTYVNEWHVSAPSALTAGFYLVAFAATALVARRARDVNRFEALALFVLLVSAITAIRSIVWFGLACVVLLPVLLDCELPTQAWRALVPARMLAAIAALLIALAAGVAATRPPAWFSRGWPDAGVRAVAAQVAVPNTRVIADDRHADWLLWKLPQLRGRMAGDVRFELYTPPQLARLSAYESLAGPHWRAAGAGYGTVVLDPRLVSQAQARAYGRPLYADSEMIVVRGASASARRS